MSKETETIEINEPVVDEVKAETPTRDAMREQGWTKAELDMAEKHGIIGKTEAKKDEKEEVEVTENKEAKTEEAKPETKEESVKEEPKEGKTRPIVPDYDLDPEQEKVFTGTFGPGSNPRALYFRMKNERQARQRAEARLKELEGQVQALKEAPRVNDQAEVNDAYDQPVTMRQLEERELKRQEAIAVEREKNAQHAATVASVQREQEEYARSIFTDFDSTVELAKEVISNVETLFPGQDWKQEKIVKQIRDLQIAAKHANDIGLTGYNAAMIAYEIGQLHPKYGKEQPTKTGSKDSDPKANGGLTPEQMKRVAENSKRNVSSASIPSGSGKRTVSVDDIGAEELNKMSYSELHAFRSKYPDKYAKIMRG